MPRRKLRKSKSMNSKQNKHNLSKTNNSNDYYDDFDTKQNDVNSMEASTNQQNFGQTSLENSQSLEQQNDFQSGDFIICRQEVFNDWPALWRIDGKSLLQKFEPFFNNGKMIYRSISTVSVHNSRIVYFTFFIFFLIIAYLFILFFYSMLHGHPRVDVYIF